MLRRASAEVGRTPWPSRRAPPRSRGPRGRAACVVKGGVSIFKGGFSTVKGGVSHSETKG